MRRFARCDWCDAVVPVADAIEADAWLRGHDCPGPADTTELAAEPAPAMESPLDRGPFS